jgi:hypothetical protein
LCDSICLFRSTIKRLTKKEKEGTFTMTQTSSRVGSGLGRAALVLSLVCSLCAVAAIPAGAQSLFRQLSQDTFSGGSGQHMSEVEPGAFAYGPTIVTAFQVARVSSGGGMDVGFATSTNGGIAWTNGYLPGLTEWYQSNGSTYSAASDASVAYDLKHGEWIINTIPIASGVDVAVNRSKDGIHWDNPIFVSKPGNADKNWIICDNTSTSPYFGNCYVGWDNSEIQMSTSSDGGLTWSSPIPTQGFDQGIGVNPVVQPNGNVVVGLYDYNVGGMAAFMSTNGGKSWTSAVYIYDAPSHGEAGGLRSAGLPSTAIDGAGNVFVSWPDCSFESGCSANDIVYSSSSDGIHWSSIVRVPIDPINSGVDHFIHGMGIDPKTSGSTAHMAITYYYYPVSNCGNSCTLYAGYTQSSDGGTTWTAGRQLSGGMQLSWLPNTFSGRMVADYVATVFPGGGRAFPIYVIANPPVSGVYQQAVYTEGYGFTFSGGSEPTFSSANDMPIPGTKSDRPPRRPEDRDNELPSQAGRTAPPEHQ